MPFFVIKQGKPRVGYDGAATVKGTFLNQCVVARTNLLNNLIKVLIQFRLGKYACMADLSKYFFQAAMPKEQKETFLELIGIETTIWNMENHKCFNFTRQL